jgi:hypothetical protein
MSNIEDGSSIFKDGESAIPFECGCSQMAAVRIECRYRNRTRTHGRIKGGGPFSAFVLQGRMVHLIGEGSGVHNCTVLKILLAMRLSRFSEKRRRL